MREEAALPRGWARGRIEDLVSLTNGYAFKPTQWKDHGLPIVRIQNLNDPDASFNQCPDAIPEKFRVREGDLLFAWSGTPGTSFGAHIWRGADAWLNQHIFRVDFNRDYLDDRFLRLAINENLDRYIRAAHGGAGLAHITKGRFEESEVMLAPLNEQHRIVAKIEELFSDLDAGVAALERVRIALKRYRASVLKAAVKGRLTEQWREENPNVEPAHELLRRILDERRQRWGGEQLAKFEAKGKQPPTGWRDTYPSPVSLPIVGLTALPHGWIWSSLGECFRVAVGATPSRREDKYWGGSIPWVSSGEVQFCRIRETRESISEIGLANASTRLNPRGSVMLGMIGEGRTRGQVAILDISAANNQNCAAIWVAETEVLPEYVYYWLWSRYEETRGRGSGNNQPALNKHLVEALPIPLPPVVEQREIVTEVETQLEALSIVEGSVLVAAARATGLRRSILARAFAGCLVPQDPTDEPASLLLQRIKTEPQHAALTMVDEGYNGPRPDCENGQT